jgi:hypothetical protein
MASTVPFSVDALDAREKHNTAADGDRPARTEWSRSAGASTSSTHCLKAGSEGELFLGRNHLEMGFDEGCVGERRRCR